jgi:mannose-6-phosphate isomerase-like protein (cupin superfamily)
VKISTHKAIAGLKYLPDRTPEMGHSAEAEAAFAELSKFRDGAIYVGYYSGSSDWEKHPVGDELVIALEGTTTLVIHEAAGDNRIELGDGDLAIVPANTWHKFEDSRRLKVMSVTPEPSEYRLEHP